MATDIFRLIDLSLAEAELFKAVQAHARISMKAHLTSGTEFKSADRNAAALADLPEYRSALAKIHTAEKKMPSVDY